MAIIGRIRKRAGLSVAVIAIAILAFIFSDLFTRQSPMPNNIARVNGEEITHHEFNEVSMNIENNMRQQYGVENLDNDLAFVAKQQSYSDILNEKLLKREFESLGLVVSQEELNDMFFGDFIHPAVRQSFSDPETGMYNKQAVSQYISQFDKLPEEQQTSWKSFENGVKRNRLEEKYEKVLAKSFYMPIKLADHIAELSNTVIDSRYTLLSFASVDDNTIELTDKDYKQYYDKHKNNFKVIESTRDVEYVRFSIHPSQEDIQMINDSVISTYEMFQTISNDEIPGFITSVSDAYYDSSFYKKEDLLELYPDSIISNIKVGSYISPFQNSSNWVMGKLTSVQARPDSIRFSSILILNERAGGHIQRAPAIATALKDSVFELVKADPNSFEANVVNFSDDPEAQNNFGDNGWILDGQFDPNLNTKVINAPVGGIFVQEIPNEMGYWIIKVTDKTTPITKYQLANIIMEIRASDQTVNQIRDAANSFLGEAVDMAAFTEVAQKQNLNIRSSQNLTQIDYQLNGTPFAREIVRWVFSKDTKKGDVAAEVFELPDMFLVVGVKDIKDKGIMSLDQVRPGIENYVRIEKKAEELMKKAEEAIKANKDINSIASKLGTEVEDAQGISFIDPYFVQAGPEMRVIGALAGAKDKGVQKPIKGFNGVYIVSIDNMTEKANKEEAALIQQSFDMKSMQKTSQLRLPLQVLLEKAKIDNNFSFFY